MKVSMKWKKDKIKVVGCVDFPQMKSEMWNEIKKWKKNKIKIVISVDFYKWNEMCKEIKYEMKARQNKNISLILG